MAVAEVEPDGVRLDNGMRLKNQELLATRPSHAVTYASCQGLTLHNRVRLDLESCHLALRRLYVGASRATSGGKFMSIEDSRQGALVWEPGNFQDDGAKRVGVCFASNTDLELWTEEVEQGVIDNMIIFQKPFPGAAAPSLRASCSAPSR